MTWQQIKERVNHLSIPNPEEATRNAVMTNEGKDKDGHGLELYKLTIYEEPEFEIEYRWTFCPECRFTVWSKFVAWNNMDGLCYERKIL